MRLIDHQHRRQFPLSAANHVAAQIQKQLALVLARRGQPKITGDILQKLDRGQPAVEDIGICNIIVLLV